MKTRKLFILRLLTMSFFPISFIQAYEHPKYFKESIAYRNIRFMPADVVGKFYQQLKIVDKIFNENGIAYWITGGTLLGAIRHGGMIPWDDDADIEIFENDGEKAVKLNYLFKEFGYEIKRWFSLEGEYVGLRISSPGTNMHPTDIFFSKKVAGKIVLASAWASRDFPKSYWLEQELFPLRRVKFGPIEVNAANNPFALIHRYFGKDALTHAVIGRIKLTIIDFSPAPYVIPESKLHLD